MCKASVMHLLSPQQDLQQETLLLGDAKLPLRTSRRVAVQLGGRQLLAKGAIIGAATRPVRGGVLKDAFGISIDLRLTWTEQPAKSWAFNTDGGHGWRGARAGAFSSQSRATARREP